MDVVVAGTEVQGFRLEPELCHHATGGPELRGKLASGVSLPPTTKPSIRAAAPASSLARAHTHPSLKRNRLAEDVAAWDQGH
jgi:hypothetical protein